MRLFNKLFNQKLQTETPEQEVLDASTHVSPLEIHSKNGNIKTTLTTSLEINTDYVRIDDRINKYYSKNNTHICQSGKNCVAFEESVLYRVNTYNESICPNCNNHLIMPKQKVTCKKCGNKVFVVEGNLKQGNMALTESEYLRLKDLRDLFYSDSTSGR